ncbi:MAG: adenylate cyclase, class 2 [Acidobacteriota bacterium]|jgi:adenylate cyclase class 2|nr:adenylate cyclase, class 2 [Acidobacteriota bacterium]
MPIEIEKKYKLKPEQVGPLRQRLKEVGAEGRGNAEFEENVIYTGPGLDPARRVLRLRRKGVRAVFTFKERDSGQSPIKRQREEETEVSDAGALAAILEALGYRPLLVYEKRRETWRIADTEVVIDELPFGLFVEIEGEEACIVEVEKLLGLDAAEAEHAPYPELTLRHGTQLGDVIESRF